MLQHLVDQSQLFGGVRRHVVVTLHFAVQQLVRLIGVFDINLGELLLDLGDFVRLNLDVGGLTLYAMGL